jgi:type IV secretory pathway TrbD component
MLFKPSKVSDSRQGGYAQKHSANSQLLMLTGLLATVLDAIINNCLISFVTCTFLILGMVAITWRRELDGLFNTITKFSGRYKITSSALTVLTTFVLLDALSTPAQAQFFQNAETWMTGQFTGADQAITLSFNVLRGLFILYLGISLVRVVQAARQDEDWQNLARTPMIILIAVTMGDILANLIIGGGGGNTVRLRPKQYCIRRI